MGRSYCTSISSIASRGSGAAEAMQSPPPERQTDMVAISMQITGVNPLQFLGYNWLFNDTLTIP